jgi:shikimate kinase
MSPGPRFIVKADASDPHLLVARSIEYALKVLKLKIPPSLQLSVKIKSDIPTAVGLKSSSAVSVATTKAVFGLFSKEADSLTILRTSCRASRDSKASITGAYDDAAASLLGGVAFTDNSRFKLIKHARLSRSLGSMVALLVPKRRKVLTSSLGPSSYSSYRRESLLAFRLAMAGDFQSAMILNSSIQCEALNYSMGPVATALAAGASAAGITGKGPAVAAICRSAKTLRRVKQEWKEEYSDCRVITTRVVQPG